jgi:lipoic acid synthetase
VVTIGQYLQPTKKHLEVQRFVHPDEFAEYREIGYSLGLDYVESGPLVRSSYHSEKHVIPGYGRQKWAEGK